MSKKDKMNTQTKDIPLIRTSFDMPKDIHQKLKLKLAMDGKKLSEYFNEQVENYTKDIKLKDFRNVK